jgi:transcription elongation factor/antiterminator RfaH
MQWYVIQTRHHKENDVYLLLEQVPLEVFYPKLMDYIRRGGRRIPVIKPFFPSYLFCRFSLESDYRLVKYTRGVIRVLGNGQEPVPIAPEIIFTIQARADAQGIIKTGSRFKKGDRVRILDGPFSDLIGILEEPGSPEGRVRVLLDLFQRQISVQFPFSELERV